MTEERPVFTWIAVVLTALADAGYADQHVDAPGPPASACSAIGMRREKRALS